MSSRLTLTLPPDLGNTEVEVDMKRFSIGRTPENDLVIEDSSLSRRHALIEKVDGRFNLSDCGSSNGTLVNGRAVTGMTELRDRDVLTFGGVSDIVVRLQDDTQPSGNEGKPAVSVAPAKSPAVAFSQNVVQVSRPSATLDQLWFSGPVIAVAAAVMILLVTGLVLLATRGTNSRSVSKPVIAKKQEPLGDNVNDDKSASIPNESTPSPVTTDPGPVPAGDPAQVELSSIEGYALKVLTGISKDTHPVLTEKPLSEINAQVQRFRGSSSLGQELRAMKRDLLQVSAAAKSSRIRIPLAVYATLARIDKDGGRGEPAPVAGQICPALAKMRTIFGDELANDSLLSVAALEEGPGLQLRITKLAGRVDSPTTIRSIWYLRDHQVISSDTYDFLLRFMAIGVIAQDPRKFSVAAEPLTF
jgi:hypothetical protein